MGKRVSVERMRSQIRRRRDQKYKPLFHLPPAASAQVALTFDDGPHPHHTEPILEALLEAGVRATFFVLGEMCERWEPQLQAMVAAGMTVGVHSWDHASLPEHDRGFVTDDLARTIDIVAAASGRRPTLFRPPYGSWSRDVMVVARRLGLRTVHWDVDTEDWKRPGVDSIVSSGLEQVADRSIVLLHDGGGDRSQTVEALPILIREIRARGFQFADLGNQAW